MDASSHDINKAKTAADSTESIVQKICRAYPEFARIEAPGFIEVIRNAKSIFLPAGSKVPNSVMQSRQFKLIISGHIRIYNVAEDGREITLYRVKAGGICVLNLSCLFSSEVHDMLSEAETDVQILCIDSSDFQFMMQESSVFRNYVLTEMNEGIIKLMDIIQDTAFNKLNLRLSCLLGQLFERANSNSIKITHQSLAHELGTTREVISRILKEFERSNCIELSRGSIKLTSSEVLGGFSKH